jgi:hypothetical protein
LIVIDLDECGVYEKCIKMARMTRNEDTLAIMHQLANELGIPKPQVEHPRTIKIINSNLS